jgi:hypothetical protein
VLNDLFERTVSRTSVIKPLIHPLLYGLDIKEQLLQLLLLLLKRSLQIFIRATSIPQQT